MKKKKKNKFKIVSRKRRNDCAICAVAMYLNKSYEYVDKELKLCHDILHDGQDVDGATYDDSVEYLLKQHGIDTRRTKNLSNIRKKALVSVYKDGWNVGHMLYFDGKRVYESNRRKGSLVFNTPMAKKYARYVICKK